MPRLVSALVGLVCLAGLPKAMSEETPPSLFDGQSLSNWTTLDGQPVPEGWEVVDGVIHLKNREQKGRSGHIVSRNEYADFTLTFDWKIAPGGNSGLKYRVQQFGKKTLGCEYQIYDATEGGKELPANKQSGSLYDLYAPSADAHLNPPGEFNTAKIVVHGNHLEHWLNGRLIVSAVVGSDDWHRRIAESKFNDAPGFAENARGRIMLTDHGSEVWYRNLTLTPFSACAQPTPSGRTTGK